MKTPNHNQQPRTITEAQCRFSTIHPMDTMGMCWESSPSFCNGLRTIYIVSFQGRTIDLTTRDMGSEFRFVLGKVLGTQDHPTLRLASDHCVLHHNLDKIIFNTCILTHTHTSIHLSIQHGIIHPKTHTYPSIKPMKPNHTYTTLAFIQSWHQGIHHITNLNHTSKHAPSQTPSYYTKAATKQGNKVGMASKHRSSHVFQTIRHEITHQTSIFISIIQARPYQKCMGISNARLTFYLPYNNSSPMALCMSI